MNFPKEEAETSVNYPKKGVCQKCNKPLRLMMEPQMAYGLQVCVACYTEFRDREDSIRGIESKVGPTAPTTENRAGGRQSLIPFRCDLLPPRALLQVAEVLHLGAEKYGAENWRKIPRRDHLNHLLMHIYAYLSGDTSDEHLSHAACRILFAMEAECEI